MKKMYSAMKLLAVGLIAVAMTACSTTNHKSVEEWQGKVWRALVVNTLIDTSTFTGDSEEWVAATKYDAKRDQGIRMARVHFSSGWTSVIANTMVPDNIEFSQIPRGTLVDVKTETGPDANYVLERHTRILRIICAKDDEKCFEVEKAAKRIRTVVDENPGDVSAQYGLTFKRRITQDDIKNYK